MKKILLFSLLSALSISLANAATDKIQYCPTIDQIKITRLQKPWTHIYFAYNADLKYFVSKEYTEDANNGPAPPTEFNPELSAYDSESKTLSCVYTAFTRIANRHPTLINIGDY